MQQSLGWDTLEVRRHLSAVTMMFKAVRNLCHLTLPASINLVHSGTRSNHPYKSRHSFAHSNTYKFSFFPRTISLWNSHPMSAVNGNTTAAFQSNAIPIIRSQFCEVIIIIIIMTLFKCQMYLARTALIGDTFQIELEFRNVDVM